MNPALSPGQRWSKAIAFFVYPLLEKKKGVVHQVLDFRDSLTGEDVDKIALPPQTQAYLDQRTRGKEARESTNRIGIGTANERE